MKEEKIKIVKFKHGIKFAIDELAEQIIGWTAGTGASGGIVGLSGGIDSTTVAYLCEYAFDKYNKKYPDKKPLKLYGVMLPSRANNSKDEEDGAKVAKALGIEAKTISIEPIAQIFISNLPEIDNEFDRGNLYSETRAIILSRIAASKNCRVMGTGNRDEDYVLGYFTKRGDGAVDNNILGELPKRLVKEVASHLGVSDSLVQRVPTAGLWNGQTDEGELGYNYAQAEIIQNGFDQGFSQEKIEEITDFKIEIINDVARRHKVNEHKRIPPPAGEVSFEYLEVE